MNAPCRLGLATLGLLLALGTAWSQNSGRVEAECKEWVDKKGYSVDYIELRTGKRQEGMAREWRGNVELGEVQPGDVVMEWLKAGNGQRAEFVEEIKRDAAGKPTAVRVSEWNLGKMVNERCHVTEDFGRLSKPRWIAMDLVLRVWRPSLLLP